EKMWMWCILTLSMVGMSACTLSPTEKSYKILMLLPVGSKSHRNVFLPLAEALAERGHKVVMVQNQPPSLKNPNIHEMYHGMYKEWFDDFNPFEEDPIFKYLEKASTFAQEFYEIEEIKLLYKRRMDFDLVIIDFMVNEMALPLAYGMPLMSIATPGLETRNSAKFGNFLNPAYVSPLARYIPPPIGILDRIVNSFIHCLPYIYWDYYVMPMIQTEISKHFPDLPPLHVLEKNQSLVLINNHFSLTSEVVPLLPSQVEVGGMHCRAAQPLPEDLLSWIEGDGEEGVVYFSLGSIARGKTLADHHKQAFIKAFARLKQRVIWKYEGDIPGLSENVLVRKWLPQQDLLAHPKIKVFIGHGGLLGLQEAMYHGTPVIIIPIFGDQLKNAQLFQHKGLGLALDWTTLTEDVIVESIHKLFKDPSYLSRLSTISHIMRDQLETPVERAVFWTEYVIRHGGAKHLRSPAAELSWVQILMLDAAIVIATCIVTILALLWYIVCTCCCKRKRPIEKNKTE
ncbi:unnamed protein product, partial [Meganyctiphanes norvegica]